uniref:Uncharacterized protein n=1 Tax=Anguilla anguilla TaxID=7936 RepID=A0A0E9P997_ANGAN
MNEYGCTHYISSMCVCSRLTGTDMFAHHHTLYFIHAVKHFVFLFFLTKCVSFEHFLLFAIFSFLVVISVLELLHLD